MEYYTLGNYKNTVYDLDKNLQEKYFQDYGSLLITVNEILQNVQFVTLTIFHQMLHRPPSCLCKKLESSFK